VPTLEINIDHPLIKYLDETRDEATFSDLSLLLFDQALLLDDGELPQPADFSRRMNSMLVRLAGVTSTAAGAKQPAL
jgi:molecular chaperone HtpG